MNILVNLRDDVIEKYKLTSDECLFISWLVNFYNSGNAKCERVNDKLYIWLTYNKVIEDLKTLNFGKRQVGRLISKLANIGLIEKMLKDNNKLYIKPNFDRLINSEFEGQKCLTLEDINDISVYGVGQKCPPIIKYNKNYIKIIINNDKVKNLDGNEFLENIKTNLKDKLSKVTFDCIFYISNIHCIADKMIIMKVSCVTLVEKYEEIFKQAILEVISEMTEKIQ